MIWRERVLPALLLATCTGAQAGRPLNVDDANVNDPGKGHVEVWAARLPGGVHSWNMAPAYAPLDGLEFSGVLSRDVTTPLNTQAVQFKWRITRATETGCNVGTSGGMSHQAGAGNTPYINALMSCNTPLAPVHLNLGASRAPGGPTLGSWGIAAEHAVGRATLHVEWFGVQQSRPTLQTGLRADIAPGWQLDATLGRGMGESLYSLGFKRSF